MLLVLTTYTELKLLHSAVISNDAMIWMLDVGQGDAILLRTADQKYMLIDAGRGDSVLSQLKDLWGGAKHKLDAAIVTHFDADHVEGFLTVTDHYRIDNLLIPEYAPVNELGKALLQKYDGTVTRLIAGKTFKIGCCTKLEVLWPSKNHRDLESNDMSVALLIDFGAVEMFTAGDLSKEYELLATTGLEVDTEILKVGHHGSKTSTSIELLDKLKPEVALIAAGFNNSYGHPHRDPLNMLAGMDIFRTDLQGRISVQITESLYKVCYKLVCKDFPVPI